MSDERCVLFIRESLFQSVISDAVTFATVVGIIGVGRYLDSPAMQWCGFIMLCVTALGRAVRAGNRSRMTPQDAANLLLEKYSVTGRPLK